MSKPAAYPVAFVFVCVTDENGVEYIMRYVAAHDGYGAADEAIRAFWGYDRERLPTTHRIREILVFENVEPRRFQYEAVVRRDFEIKEFPS